MAACNFFNSFKETMPEKVHNLGSDQLVVALTAAANAPVASNTVLANLTQISYTNCSSRNITTSTSSQTSGTYKLVLTDLVLTASGGNIATFRYVVVYNDTATNDELLWWYDYGSDVTITSGNTFTIDFDATNGAISLT